MKTIIEQAERILGEGISFPKDRSQDNVHRKDNSVQKDLDLLTTDLQVFAQKLQKLEASGTPDWKKGVKECRAELKKVMDRNYIIIW